MTRAIGIQWTVRPPGPVIGLFLDLVRYSGVFASYVSK